MFGQSGILNYLWSNTNPRQQQPQQRQQEHQQHQHQQYYQQHQQQPPPQKDIPPPASYRAISNLPVVKVTADDLLEETNKECLICLEEQRIGTQACKLPCGHLYHRQCLTEWLYKHCTCPVCRFEIETDDAAYEQRRTKKMRERKQRCRRDELDSKSVHQLRELMGSLGVSAAGCIDKRELVDRLVQSGRIIITEGVPALEISSEEFSGYSVARLRQLLASFGIDFSGAIEKFELRDLLLETGRVVLVEPSPPPPPPAAAGTIRMTSQELGALSVPELRQLITSFGLSDAGVIYKDGLRAVLVDAGCVMLEDAIEEPAIAPAASPVLQNSSSEAVHPQSAAPDDRLPIHEELLSAMGIRELMEFMVALGISTESCVERGEMISRIRNCDRILFMTDE